MPFLAVAYAVVLAVVLTWSHHRAGQMQRKLDAKERSLVQLDHDVNDLIGIALRLHQRVCVLEGELARPKGRT